MINITRQELIKVNKPARYIGGEYNQIVKGSNAKLRIALCYPNLYDIGMNDYLIQQAYTTLNSNNDIWCELAFAPDYDFEKLLRKKKVNLYTLESKESIDKFDIVAFRIKSVLDYTNILNMLELSNIPIFSEERYADKPLIVGILDESIVNPYPISNFFDVIFLGKPNDIYEEFIFRYNVYKSQNKTKSEFIASISNMQGIFIPKITKATKYANLKNIRKIRYSNSMKVSSLDINQKVIIKVDNTDTRVYMEDTLLMVNNVKESIKNSGIRKVLLTGDKINSYDNLEILVQELLNLYDGTVKVYIDDLKFNNKNLGIFKLIDKYTKPKVNFNVISTNTNLREILGIKETIDDIIDNIKLAFENNYNNICLTFYIGLPDETYSNLDEIIKFIKQVKSIFYNINSNRREAKCNLVVNIKNFISIPNTIYQYFPQIEYDKYELKQKFLKESLYDVQIIFENAYMSNINNLLLRGDDNIANVIYNAFKNGARFDNLLSESNINHWKRSIRVYNPNLEELVFKSKRDFIWDNITTYNDKENLKERFEKVIGSDKSAN